jgi:hypothetical protein
VLCWGPKGSCLMCDFEVREVCERGYNSSISTVCKHESSSDCVDSVRVHKVLVAEPDTGTISGNRSRKIVDAFNAILPNIDWNNLVLSNRKRNLFHRRRRR